LRRAEDFPIQTGWKDLPVFRQIKNYFEPAVILIRFNVKIGKISPKATPVLFAMDESAFRF